MYPDNHNTNVLHIHGERGNNLYMLTTTNEKEKIVRDIKLILAVLNTLLIFRILILIGYVLKRIQCATMKL